MLKNIKDNFSDGSEAYKRFRPVYPIELYQHIYNFVPAFGFAWDCATGNGQVAEVLAESFDRVIATDVSRNQLIQAKSKSNIEYHLLRSEETLPIDDHSLDLITVGQAAHWFDIPAFFTNAHRYLKKEGALCIWGYGTLTTSDTDLHSSILHFYQDVVGPYWDPERRLVDSAYREIRHDSFTMIDYDQQYYIPVDWTAEHLRAYFGTWSAVRHFINQNGFDPVAHFYNDHNHMRYEGTRHFKFPLFLKIFRMR